MAEAKFALESLSAQPDIRALARERELALEKYWYSINAARNEGRVEGAASERANLLKRLLAQRFGDLPEWAVARINTASAEQLNAWVDAILSGPSLAKVLGSE